MTLYHIIVQYICIHAYVCEIELDIQDSQFAFDRNCDCPTARDLHTCTTKSTPIAI